jgi:hypothetical protein
MLAHYLGVADSILDPLSWLLKTYVCKNQEEFRNIQNTVSWIHDFGKSQVAGWLETGIREALDILVEAETHISLATVSLQGVNTELENGGLERARQAARDIETALGELDTVLALRNPDTGTDLLTQKTYNQLEQLARNILGD